MVRTTLFAVTLLSCLGPANSWAQDDADMTLDICPNNFINFPMDISGLRCTCSAEQAKADATIWGGNPYDSGSDICRAAVHAGAITTAGGAVRITPAIGVKVFPSVTRNDIRSASSGADDGYKVDIPGASGAATDTAPTNALVTATDICPNNLINFPADSPPLSCTCSSERAKADATIWGANPYDSGSDVCRAALHAGAISTDGGEIRVISKTAVPVFPSLTRNGIRSASSGAGDGYAIEAGPSAASPIKSVDMTSEGMTFDICPNSFINFPADGAALKCGCSAEQAKADATIWGANPYDAGSDICRAAVHAGAITSVGGEVKVASAMKVPVFPSVTRNGVRSASSGAGDGYTVAAASGAATSVAPIHQTETGMTFDVCPNNYINFPMDSPPLTCGCSAEQAKADATIWGANPYDAGSDICRAAAHAGAIATTGGQVRIAPTAGVKVFPSVTRNDVRSASANAGDGYTVEVTNKAAAPAVDAAGQPVQAPIAATLKTTGRVQLYINFATDKADPLPSSAPILAELLTTLRDDSGLRLDLIGHTDSQGGAGYNLDLSQRRAASVYLFLVQSGVQPERLRASGRGLLEPIADNATVEGRALNRRVEARRLQ